MTRRPPYPSMPRDWARLSFSLQWQDQAGALFLAGELNLSHQIITGILEYDIGADLVQVCREIALTDGNDFGAPRGGDLHGGCAEAIARATNDHRVRFLEFAVGH